MLFLSLGKRKGEFHCGRKEKNSKGVLSSPVPDVTGYNNTMLTTTGLLKRLSGKKNGVIYLRVYDAGNNADFADKVGTEYTLEEINQMAAQKGGTPDQSGRFY